MLTDVLLEQILTNIPRLTVGVLGDLFLDRYLDLDATLTEPSLETGLDAYQVVQVRATPGAAGTVINNLAALGVKTIIPLAIVGDDGEGYELRQALSRLPTVSAEGLLSWPDRRTPTYTKPMLGRPGETPRELHRLDIKNRAPTPRAAEDQLLHTFEAVWPSLDALLVLDQVSEPDCGVVTARVRATLEHFGSAAPEKLILADSRERIGLFRSVWIKPNFRECCQAIDGSPDPGHVLTLAQRTRRPVFCTCSDQPMQIADPRRGQASQLLTARIFPVSGPVDPVGAGDSVSAALACALASGVDLVTAGEFGNLVASITIQQIGTTGTASPEQVRRRWSEVCP